MALSAGAPGELDSLNACQELLLRSQCAEGSWSDWALPPGPSDCWTTGYVGFQLAGAPEPLLATSEAARRAAAAWLVEREFPEGGWGYHEGVGSDADSTAWALLFLRAQGVDVRPSAYGRLLGLQSADGGFSTYSPDDGLGSWGSSTPDVTAVAALALLPTAEALEVPLRAAASGGAPGRAEAVERALRYLAGQRRADGIWDSFWWRSPVYATAAALRLLRATGAAVDAAAAQSSLACVQVTNAFERALLVDCELDADPERISDRTSQLLAALVAEQLPDGSWQSAAVLRLTDRDCFDPAGRDDAGPLFADPRRLFTSATVFGALSRFVCRVAPL
jgi:hypothetical protein